MLLLGLPEYSFRFPLPFSELALKVWRSLPSFDPVNLILMRAAIHIDAGCDTQTGGGGGGFDGRAGGLQRALSTMAAHDAVALNQAVVERVRDRVNPKLRILAIIPTFYDGREILTHEIMEKLQEAFGDLVCETAIRRNTDTARAAGWAQAVVTVAPKTLGGQDYMALTEELLLRMKKRGRGR
jgi:hypothetical protein